MQNQTKLKKKAASQNKPKADKKNKRRGPQPAELAHVTESRKREIWQNRPAGGLCCVLHYLPSLFFFFLSGHRGKKKKNRKQNRIATKSEKKNNPKPKKTKPKKPTYKTFVNSLGSPCCQGSRPWPVPTGGELPWEACMDSRATPGRRCAAAAGFGAGGFGGVAVRKERREKPAKRRRRSPKPISSSLSSCEHYK